MHTFDRHDRVEEPPKKILKALWLPHLVCTIRLARHKRDAEAFRDEHGLLQEKVSFSEPQIVR